MRVYSEELAPSGKKRILFACGIEDIKILCELVNNAKLHIPRLHTEENSTNGLLNRLRSMAKEFSKFLSEKETHKSLPKTTQCPYCERKLRGQKALEEHIKMVHSREGK